MSLNTLNTGEISFKKLSGKAHTQQGFAVTEEGIASNIQISYGTVFGSPIEPLPVTNSGLTTLYSTNGKVQRIKFQLDIVPNTQIGVNQSQSYRLKLPADWNTHPGALYPEFTASTYLHTALGKLQIVPTLYGKLKTDGSTEYDPILYQTNGSTVITKFDSINWYLDTYSGILFVQDPPVGYDISASRPGFLEAFLFVGKYLDSVVSGSSGSGSGTITGATNGLSVSGKKIKLGGTFTGDTLIGDLNKSGMFFIKDNSVLGGLGYLPNSVNVFNGNVTGSSFSVIGISTGTTFISSISDNGNPTEILISTEYDLPSSKYVTGNFVAQSVSGGTSIVGNYSSSYSGLSTTVSLILSSSLTGTTPTSKAVIGLYNPSLGLSPINSIFSGLEYDSDYSPYYTSRSLIDYGFLTGSTLVTGATNGLHLINRNVAWGGILTGNVDVGGAGVDRDVTFGFGVNNSIRTFSVLTAKNDNSNFIYTKLFPDADLVPNYELRAVVSGTTTGQIIIDPTGMTIGSGAVRIAGSNPAIWNPQAGFLFPGDSSNPFWVYDASGRGLQYKSDYSAGYGPRSLIDYGYFTAHTSGFTSGGTSVTANNGLRKSGANIHLGGSLTGDTFINLNGHQLTISGASSSDIRFAANGGIYFPDPTGGGTYFDDLGGGGVYFNDEGGGGIVIGSTNFTGGGVSINGKNSSTIDLSIYHNNNNQFILTLSDSIGARFLDNRTGTTAHGIEYAANYASTYTSRSLVDKGYVTGLTSSIISPVGFVVTGSSFTATTNTSFVGVSGTSISTIYLPASPTAFKPYILADIKGNASTVNVTINGNGKLIQGSTTALIDTNYGSITFIYNSFNWSVVASA